MIADHLSQFVSVNRNKIDLKNTNINQRDNKNFNSTSFRDDDLNSKQE